jgi:hypothetical protein
MKLNLFQGDLFQGDLFHGAVKSSKSAFDVGRAKFRLEGLSHYASVSALLLNAALRMFSSTPKKLDHRKHENVMKIAFLVFITATVICGAYTTMVFSLSSLYAKSFLGMGMDDEYLDFIEATSEIRKTAFLSFVATILSFNFSFVLSLYLSYEGPVRFWITTITTVAILMGVHNYMLIMKYASKMFEGR